MGLYGGFAYGGDTYSGSAELVAFNYELGIEQGRVQPDNETPIDGDYVFALGTDRLPGPVLDLAIGDRAEVAQEVNLSDTNYVRATWRVVQPSSMPEKATLSVAALKLGNVMGLKPADFAGALQAIVTSVDTFVHGDLHRIVRIAGAVNPGNNGDKRITGIVDAKTAILDNGIIVTENPFLGTATLIGARWRASLLVAGVTHASVTEVDGESKRRTDLVAHVSKIVGRQQVKFRLELIEQP